MGQCYGAVLRGSYGAALWGGYGAAQLGGSVTFAHFLPVPLPAAAPFCLCSSPILLPFGTSQHILSAHFCPFLPLSALFCPFFLPISAHYFLLPIPRCSPSFHLLPPSLFWAISLNVIPFLFPLSDQSDSLPFCQFLPIFPPVFTHSLSGLFLPVPLHHSSPSCPFLSLSSFSPRFLPFLSPFAHFCPFHPQPQPGTPRPIWAVGL